MKQNAKNDVKRVSVNVDLNIVSNNKQRWNDD